MKKSIICLLLVAILALGAGFGTLAYYTNTFTSNENTIVTAKFNPDKGSSQWSRTELIDGQSFAPGKDISLSYGIDLKETEVPIKYVIIANNRNEVPEDLYGMFSQGSPIKFELSVYDNGAGKTTVLQKNINGEYEFTPSVNARRAVFFVKYIWPFESFNNDVRIPDEMYANKKGFLDLSIEVRQIREEDANYIDGNPFTSSFGVSKGADTSYAAEIGFKQPLSKQLKSLSFVALDKDNKRIADSQAAPQLLVSLNEGFEKPLGNKFILKCDDTGITVRPSTGSWNTNKFSDNKIVKIQAFFEFANDPGVYCVEQIVN